MGTVLLLLSSSGLLPKKLEINPAVDKRSEGRQWAERVQYRQSAQGGTMCDSPAMSKQSDTQTSNSFFSNSVTSSPSLIGTQNNTGWSSSSFAMTELGNLWKPSVDKFKVVQPKTGGGGSSDKPSDQECRQVFFDCAL